MSFARATTSVAPIAGSAGRTMSIETATRAVNIAIRATNSPKPIAGAVDEAMRRASIQGMPGRQQSHHTRLAVPSPTRQPKDECARGPPSVDIQRAVGRLRHVNPPCGGPQRWNELDRDTARLARGFVPDHVRMVAALVDERRPQRGGWTVDMRRAARIVSVVSRDGPCRDGNQAGARVSVPTAAPSGLPDIGLDEQVGLPLGLQPRLPEIRRSGMSLEVDLIESSARQRRPCKPTGIGPEHDS
jgi:hypothetical protein